MLASQAMTGRRSMSHPSVSPWAAGILMMACVAAGGFAQGAADALTVEAAAARITLPEIKFEDVSLADACEYFRIKSRDHGPVKRGVNILVTDTTSAGRARCTLNLANVPLKEALVQVAKQTGWKLRFDPHVAVFTKAAQPVGNIPKPDPSSPVLQRASAIIRPSAQFADATVEEAVEFLRIPIGCINFPAPARRPVNLVTKLPARLSGAPIISMDLRNVSLLEILSYIAEIAGLKVRVGETALILEEASAVGAAGTAKSAGHSQAKSPLKPLSKMEERASMSIMPRVDFAEATVQECVEFLHATWANRRNTDGDSLAVAVVLATPKGMALPKITLYLTDAPLREVLGYLAELAGLSLRSEDKGFVLEAR